MQRLEFWENVFFLSCNCGGLTKVFELSSCPDPHSLYLHNGGIGVCD